MRIGRGDIRKFWNVNSFTPIRAKLGSRPILHLYVAQTVNRSTLNPLHSCTILSLVYVDCLLLESNIYCNSKNMVPNGNWNLFWMWCSLQFIGIDFFFNHILFILAYVQWIFHPNAIQIYSQQPISLTHIRSMFCWYALIWNCYSISLISKYAELT